MLKIDWHYLCVEMIIGYITQDIDTLESYEKYQDVSTHFIVISNILRSRIKTERNIVELNVDDTEETNNIAQIMRRIIVQCLYFVKQQHKENNSIATAAAQKYEEMLVNNELSVSQRVFIEQQIKKLQDDVWVNDE